MLRYNNMKQGWSKVDDLVGLKHTKAESVRQSHKKYDPYSSQITFLFSISIITTA